MVILILNWIIDRFGLVIDGLVCVNKCRLLQPRLVTDHRLHTTAHLHPRLDCQWITVTVWAQSECRRWRAMLRWRLQFRLLWIYRRLHLPIILITMSFTITRWLTQRPTTCRFNNNNNNSIPFHRLSPQPHRPLLQLFRPSPPPTHLWQLIIR